MSDSPELTVRDLLGAMTEETLIAIGADIYIRLDNTHEPEEIAELVQMGNLLDQEIAERRRFSSLVDSGLSGES